MPVYGWQRQTGPHLKMTETERDIIGGSVTTIITALVRTVRTLVRTVYVVEDTAAATLFSPGWLCPTIHGEGIDDEQIFWPLRNRLILVAKILGHVITNTEWNHLTSPLSLELEVNALVNFSQMKHVFVTRIGLVLGVMGVTVQNDAVHGIDFFLVHPQCFTMIEGGHTKHVGVLHPDEGKILLQSESIHCIAVAKVIEFRRRTFAKILIETIGAFPPVIVIVRRHTPQAIELDSVSEHFSRQDKKSSDQCLRS